MASHLPPVPPEQQSDKGPNAAPTPKPHEKPPAGTKPQERDTAAQGRQGSVHQNTRNVGYQQDR